MKCKYCGSELTIELVPIGAGFYVAVSCGCGACWALNVYSLDELTETCGPD